MLVVIDWVGSMPYSLLRMFPTVYCVFITVNAPLHTLRVSLSPLLLQLKPLACKVPSEIKFFLNLGICQTSHDVLTPPSSIAICNCLITTRFVVTHTVTVKIVGPVCGEPLPVGSHMVIISRIKNPCICQLTTWTRENISLIVVDISFSVVV